MSRNILCALLGLCKYICKIPILDAGDFTDEFTDEAQGSLGGGEGAKHS